MFFLFFVFLGVAHRVAHRVAHGLAHGPRPRFCPLPLDPVVKPVYNGPLYSSHHVYNGHLTISQGDCCTQVSLYPPEYLRDLCNKRRVPKLNTTRYGMNSVK